MLILTDILVVEDNIEMGSILCEFLQGDGYNTKLCNDGESAIDYFQKNGAKIVILDIMLSNIDGFAVCKKIRESNNTPIIMVSAKIEKDNKLNGLLLGADDYIEKPYDIDILLAKVSGIFKRRYNNDIITDGNIKIDRIKHTVYKDNNEVPMTQKEFDLLVLLMNNKGKTLNKEVIFNKIWGCDSFSEQQTLTVHIKWLRQKIEDNPKNPKKILTVWGIGYRYEKV